MKCYRTLYLTTFTAGEFLKSDFEEEPSKELTPLINSLLIKINLDAIFAFADRIYTLTGLHNKINVAW